MGWFPVCDPKEKVPIIGWRYRLEDGRLAIRWSGMRLMFDGVPPEIVAKFAGHAMASVYYRSQIKGRYPCVEVKKYDAGEAYHPKENGDQRKRTRQAKDRLAEVKQTLPIEVDLFGQIRGTSKSITHS